MSELSRPYAFIEAPSVLAWAALDFAAPVPGVQRREIRRFADIAADRRSPAFELR
jgi:hypothetical protein